MCCAMAQALAHTSPVLRATVRCAAACVNALGAVTACLIAREPALPNQRASEHVGES